MKVPAIINKTVSVPNMMNVTMNLTDFEMSNWSLDNSRKLMNLVGNDHAIFSFKDFTGGIKANYMFITDPPLFADIGQINFQNPNTTFSVNGFSDEIDGEIRMNIENISLDMDPFTLHFDGISDTSDVVSRFITFSGNIIRDRMVSLSKYPKALDKLNHVINAVIDIIPDEIDMPATDLYI